MISDEERRAVAVRMREILRDDPHGWLDAMVVNAVTDVMGEGVAIGETVADLIDRPTCRIGYVPGSADRSCSACGATFSTGTYQGGDHEEHEFMFCPNCGAEVSRREPNDEWQPTAEEKGAER